jgi:hypothetical protein
VAVVKGGTASEDRAVRLLSYTLFFGCAVGLVFTLYIAIAPWVGFVAGVLTFGPASAWMFVREVEQRQIAAAAARHSGGAWRDDDEEDA